MKIIQTADNHIGETGYARLDPTTGLNARALDFLSSFRRIAQLTLDRKADVLLVVGDLFTRVNPHPKYIHETMSTIKVLSDKGVNVIILSGNHEQPRKANTLNPIKFFQFLERVHVVTYPCTITIDGIDFVCIPAPSDFGSMGEVFRDLVSEALQTSDNNRKIMLAHTEVAGAKFGSERYMGTFSGDSVDLRDIPKTFEYVGLGHVHKCQKINHSKIPIYYSGSSERYNFGEEGETKYVLEINLDENLEITKIPLQTRNMVTLLEMDCSKLSASKISYEIESTIKEKRNEIQDAIVRIKLENLHANEGRRLSWGKIRQLFLEAGAFEFRPQYRLIDESIQTQYQEKYGYVLPPDQELKEYLTETKGNNIEKTLEMGINIIRETEESKNEA